MSDRCYSCLKIIKTKGYCSTCKKYLFDGINIKPLHFDKTEFYEVKTQMTDKISISGVQDKISLTFDGSKTLKPTDKNGRYILKPIPRNHDSATKLEDIAANEHLCMQLSQQVFNIPTAYNGLIEFSDGELAYITKRFDYVLNEETKQIEKLDQEDFASIVGQTKDTHGDHYKYDSSYEEIADNIKRVVAASVPALEDFYIRVVFNYLIGNGDAHLKNFSLTRGLGRVDYSLTPNYDVLYSKYHIKEDSDMALDLFKNIETTAFGAMGYYTLEDFETFAEVLGIKKRRLTKIFQNILQTQKTVYEMTESSFLSQNAKDSFNENFEKRLKECLCYSISGYKFVGITQPIIDKYLH